MIYINDLFVIWQTLKNTKGDTHWNETFRYLVFREHLAELTESLNSASL